MIRSLAHPSRGKEYILAGDCVRTRKYKYMPSKNLLLKVGQRSIDDQPVDNSAKKEEMKNMFKARTDKLIERYRGAVKTNVDHPFYVPVANFELAPQDIIDQRQDNLVSEVPPGKDWLLDRGYNDENLTPVPAGYRRPLAMSAKLPDDTYRVYLLAGSKKGIDRSAENMGFTYRFISSGRFKHPGGKEFVRKDTEKGTRFYYLDLGKVTVKDNKFFLEINIQKDAAYSVYHVKFVPSSVRPDAPKASRDAQNEEFNRKRKELRSLGYLE